MRGLHLALLALSRVAQLLAQVHTAATMLRVSTDKENAKIANKSLEFVNIIKADLRRDNDDYAAAWKLGRRSTLTSGADTALSTRELPRHTLEPADRPLPIRAPLIHPPPIRVPPIRPPPIRPPTIRPSPIRPPTIRPSPIRPPTIRPSPIRPPTIRPPPIRPPMIRPPTIRPPPIRPPSIGPPPYRRAPPRQPLNRGIPTRAPPNRRPLTPKPLAREPLNRGQFESSIDTRRALNATNNLTSGTPILLNATLFRSYTHPVKHFKKVRVDKLKRLIDKGKSRLLLMGRTGTSPMNGASTADGGGTPPAPAGQPDAPPASPTPPPAPVTQHREPDNERDRAHALRQHIKMGSPSPNQLDMAPARGRIIQQLRFKGRLCQRSVLNAEGPRYDALGSSLAPAQRPENAHGRLFVNTNAPLVILPRCCNCCKKSVLGCQ